MTARRARNGGGLLTVASCLLVLLAAAQGYVSFRAQYTFVDHAKRAPIPSTLEALGLDTGAVIFALLALSLARRGRSGTVERVLNVACALGSLTMNLLAADLTSPRSVTVWVMPSALYALASDRVIAVVRRWAQASDPTTALAQDGSAWRAAGGLVLWVLRLCFDVPGTVGGFRRWVLAAAPVAPGTRAATLTASPAATALTEAGGTGTTSRYATPGSAVPAAPGKFRDHPQGPTGEPGDGRAPGETKRAALIRLYERCGQDGDPRYGNRAKSAALAGEIASRIGYHPGTARRELAKYLAAQNGAAPSPQPEPDMQAVA
jgi:hypothetical protein